MRTEGGKVDWFLTVLDSTLVLSFPSLSSSSSSSLNSAAAFSMNLKASSTALVSESSVFLLSENDSCIKTHNCTNYAFKASLSIPLYQLYLTFIFSHSAIYKECIDTLKGCMLTLWCPLLLRLSRWPKARCSCVHLSFQLHPQLVLAVLGLAGTLHLRLCLCSPPPVGTWNKVRGFKYGCIWFPPSF